MAEIVRALVEAKANLRTNESVIYKAVGQEFASHKRVKHALGQYVRYDEDGETVTTNRIEGFWPGVKRQIGGTHHSVSRKHLHRHVSEAEFEYNNRKLTDADRTVKLIQSSAQRLLTHAKQVTIGTRRATSRTEAARLQMPRERRWSNDALCASYTLPLSPPEDPGMHTAAAPTLLNCPQFTQTKPRRALIRDSFEGVRRARSSLWAAAHRV